MRSFLGLLLGVVLLPSLLVARTRQDVVNSAGTYQGHSWKPTANNILDKKKYFDENKTVITPPIDGEGDGIDDRAQTTVSPFGNLNLWPFRTNQTVTGVAYVWGGWTKGPLRYHGYDTWEVFDKKIKQITPYNDQKWIAGGRTPEDLPRFPENETIVPNGYHGYAGLDCSALVSRVWGLTNQDATRYSTTSLANGNVLLATTAEEMKPGDCLLRSGSHVIIFSNWLDNAATKRKARVIVE